MMFEVYLSRQAKKFLERLDENTRDRIKEKNNLQAHLDIIYL